jgi:peptidoglycan/LPS O-acetylase OafA/YrhL
MNSNPQQAALASTTADRRNYALDLLRGVAVLLVLALHTPVPDSWNSAGGVLGAAVVVRNLGWAGVDLFFVLSGFLISGLLFVELQQSGKLEVSRFWMRRGMKIWPSYFAAYGIMFLLTLTLQTAMLGFPFWDTAHDSSIAAIPNVLFVQNYVWPETRWFASWSLAIEEHFYLVLPLVLAGIAMLRPQWHGRSIVAFCIAACVGVPIMRHFACGGADQDELLMQTHLRADALCFGVLLGYVHHHHRQRFLAAARFWPLYVIATIAALALVHYYPRTDTWLGGTFGFTALYLAFGGLVVLAAAYPHAGRSSRLLGWITTIGVYSYTIYVVQAITRVGPGFKTAQRTADSLAGMELPVEGTIFVATTILGGVLLSHLVERPCLKIRERWFPKNARKYSFASATAPLPVRGTHLPARETSTTPADPARELHPTPVRPTLVVAHSANPINKEVPTSKRPASVETSTAS